MRTLIRKTTVWDESERPFAAGAFAGSNILEVSDSLFSFKNPARLFRFSNPDALFKSKNNLFSKDGRSVEVKNLKSGLRVEINENLLSVKEPLGLGKKETISIP